jgi:amino acid transporter
MHYATRWLDPAFGFSLGYTYWFSFAIALPTEITAAAIVISYWDTQINPGVWITAFLVVIVFVNLYVELDACGTPFHSPQAGYLSCGVRYYGEAEFWFSFIKVATVRKTMSVILMLQWLANSS